MYACISGKIANLNPPVIGSIRPGFNPTGRNEAKKSRGGPGLSFRRANSQIFKPLTIRPVLARIIGLSERLMAGNIARMLGAKGQDYGLRNFWSFWMLKFCERVGSSSCGFVHARYFQKHCI